MESAWQLNITTATFLTLPDAMAPFEGPPCPTSAVASRASITGTATRDGNPVALLVAFSDRDAAVYGFVLVAQGPDARSWAPWPLAITVPAITVWAADGLPLAGLEGELIVTFVCTSPDASTSSGA